MGLSGKFPEDDLHGRLRRVFPRLTQLKLTSPADTRYNCIAFAAGRSDDWWWPDPYGTSHWPADAPREATLAAFLIAFGQLGY